MWSREPIPLSGGRFLSPRWPILPQKNACMFIEKERKKKQTNPRQNPLISLSLSSFLFFLSLLSVNSFLKNRYYSTNNNEQFDVDVGGAIICEEVLVSSLCGFGLYTGNTWPGFKLFFLIIDFIFAEFWFLLFPFFLFILI